jgi:cell volume regulation protein A
MQIAMFLTFGLLVFPSQLQPVIGLGVLVTAFLTFVARPLSVLVSLAFSRFGWRQQVFLSWVGLRGAAPIILATFPLVAGADGAQRIFNVVFFVVLSSVLLQGTTIPLVARWLRLQGPAFQPAPPLSDVLPGSTLVEYRVRSESRLVGRQLAKAGLPDTAKALLVRRYGNHQVLTGSARLRRDDVLVIVADEAATRQLDGRTDLERLEGPAAICGVARSEPAQENR